MNIYINVEVKPRDLEGRMLAGMVAAERGHQVLLGHKSQVIRPVLSGQMMPGIVHEKSLTPSKVRIDELDAYKRLGFVCTSQDEESGLLDEDYSEFAANRYSQATVNAAGAIFTWGKFDKAGLKDMYPASAAKVVETGNPRVDFWREEFDAYYTEADTLGLKDYILFPSNFGGVLHHQRMWELVQSARKLGYFDRATDEVEIYRSWAFNLRLLGDFVSLIRATARKFPATSIVVRPHPIESAHAWRQHLGEVENVVVTKENSIGAWVRNSAAVVHNGCTTALEATACGKPVIAYRPSVSEYERYIPNAVSTEAFNESDVFDLVTTALNTRSTRDDLSDKHRQLLQERFSNLDGALAADNLVASWEGFGALNSAERNRLGTLRSIAAPHRTRHFVRSAAHRVLHQLKLKNEPIRSKFPGLSRKEVARIHRGCIRSLNRFEKLDVKVLNPHLVSISQSRP